jgi:RHS repeat-associated protein
MEDLLRGRYPRQRFRGSHDQFRDDFAEGAVKMYAVAISVAVSAACVSPSALAQSCTLDINGWRAKYTLSVGAAAACTGPTGTSGSCNYNQSSTAIPRLTGGGCGWKSLTDSVTSISFHDRGTWSCPAGGTLTESFDGTSGKSASFLNLNASANTYTFDPQPIANVTETLSGCTSGSAPGTPAAYPASHWPQTFTLPPTVQPLIQNNFSFQALDPMFGGLVSDVPWTFSFTLTPIYDCQPCREHGGPGAPISSDISFENGSLGEDLPIVGTGFHLHYESGRAPGAGKSAAATADASMLAGWTLNIHHAYDPATNTLFLGDGTQRSGYEVGRPVPLNGNYLLTSEDGSEVYVFSGTSGLHIETLRPMTGALLYQFGYDSAGELSTVTDNAGNVTAIRRNAREQPTAIVSPYGQTTTMTVDASGFLGDVKDPLGTSSSLRNSSTGLLLSRTDGNGNTFSYTYDTTGALTKDADPLGGYVSLARTSATSGFGWTVGQTTSMGHTSSFKTTMTLPWTQNGSSPVTEQHTNVWPNGLTATSSKVLKNGQLSDGYSLPDGTSESGTSAPDPRWGIQVPVVTSKTLKLGTLSMSIAGSRTDSLGTVGNPFTLVSQTDRQTVNGRAYSSVFTTSNRTFVDTTPVGRKLTTVLDSKERVSSTQIAGLTASGFAYDSRGRLSTIAQGTRTATLTYDTDGRLETAADPLGHRTSFTYDADGRVLTTTLPDGRVIAYRYDSNGNLTSVTPPGRSAHDFNYSAVNQVSEYVPPSVSGTGATSYAYNLDRNITKITRPDGKLISFDYDSAGRLSSVATPSETIDYTYSSSTGNLTAASITSGESLAYGYNGPLQTSTQWSGTIDGAVGVGYNDNFWITSESINGSSSIAFTYDNDGLLTQAGAMAVTHNSQNGLLTGTALGSTTDTRSYNSFGELTGYTASHAGMPLYAVSYTRDADGRVSGRSETIAGKTATYAYTYDSAGRLTGVSENGSAISSYAYDTNSNRLKAVTSSGTANGAYDAQDRLLTYGSESFTYTANGELATQTAGTAKTTYQYDVLGNLTGVTLPGGKAISYVIDAENRRVGKKVNGALAEGFLYDGDRIIAQLSASNTIVSQFVYATGSVSPDYMISGGVTYRIIDDQLGSPRLVVNTSTGAIVEQITYDEFGNVLSDTNPGFQPLGFAGGLYDRDTKLVRFGVRDYNPALGRWTAKDPIRFGGGDTNLYGYSFADSVNFVDHSGLDGDCACSRSAPVKTPKPIPFINYTPGPDEVKALMASALRSMPPGPAPATASERADPGSISANFDGYTMYDRKRYVGPKGCWNALKDMGGITNRPRNSPSSQSFDPGSVYNPFGNPIEQEQRPDIQETVVEPIP